MFTNSSPKVSKSNSAHEPLSVILKNIPQCNLHITNRKSREEDRGKWKAQCKALQVALRELSRFFNSEYYCAKRLFPFVFQLRLQPCGTNWIGTKEKSRFIRIIFAVRNWVYQDKRVEKRIKSNAKAGFPLTNIFARSDFFPLSLSFRLKPSGTN